MTTKTCNSCGTSLNEKARFCPECGTKQGLACPNCGAEQPEGAVFCGLCGAKVNEQEGQNSTGQAIMSAKTAEKSKSSDVSRSNEEQENRVKTDTPLKFSRYDCAVITVVITALLLWATLLLATKVSFLNKQVIIMYIAPLSVVSLYFNYNIMSIRDIIFICGGLHAISLIYVLIFMFKHDNTRFKILKFIALTWAWISFVVIAIIIGVIIHCLRDNAEYSRENNAKRAALDVISRALKNR